MRTELVTTLKRQATTLLAEVQKSKQPILITEHGRHSAYLIDADGYELLLKRMAILEGVARGQRAILQGETVTHVQAKQRMAKWLQ